MDFRQRASSALLGLAETAWMSAPGCLEPLWYYSVNLLAYHFGGRAQEHSFGGRIEEDYSLAFIDSDDGIDRRINNGCELLNLQNFPLLILLAEADTCSNPTA